MPSPSGPEDATLSYLFELSGLVLAAVDATRAADREGRAALRLAAIALEAAAIREVLRARLNHPVPE